MLTLRPVSPETYEAALALRLHPHQDGLMTSVVQSIAEAYVYKGAEPRLAYEAETPVGFTLAMPQILDGQPTAMIFRLMIDRDHQGRGLGRALLNAVETWCLTWRPRPVQVKISAVPDNIPALTLYRGAGYVDAGEEHGEIVLIKTITVR